MFLLIQLSNVTEWSSLPKIYFAFSYRFISKRRKIFFSKQKKIGTKAQKILFSCKCCGFQSLISSVKSHFVFVPSRFAEKWNKRKKKWFDPRFRLSFMQIAKFTFFLQTWTMCTESLKLFSFAFTGCIYVICFTTIAVLCFFKINVARVPKFPTASKLNSFAENVQT